MQHKPKFGWLYMLIVLCVLFSGVMAWTLIDKLAQQNRSAQAYDDISREAVVTGETEFLTQTPALTEEPLPNEEESVDQNDTLFYISHDVASKSETEDSADPSPTASPMVETTVKATVQNSPVEAIQNMRTYATTEDTPDTATPAPMTAETADRAPDTVPDATPLAVAITGASTISIMTSATESSSPFITPADTAASTDPGTAAPAGEGWTLLTPTPDVPAGEEPKTAEETVSGGLFFVQPTATAARSGQEPAVTATTPTQENMTPEASDKASESSAVPSNATVAAPTPTPIATHAPTPSPTAEAATPTPENLAHNRVVVTDKVRFSVDFPYLQSINADVKAWIMQEGTPINYPVVQGKDNEYYLNHLFNRSVNKDGAIFLDSGNADTFSDANLYVYGHHTKTDSMFSTLAEYREQAYYEAHPQLTLLTPYSDYQIDLFAAAVFQADDETSWRLKQFSRKAEFDAYISQLESASLFTPHADAAPEWGDQLLVLVTCTNNQHGERYVVYGRMRQLMYTSSENVSVTKVAMDERPTLTAWEKVPGRGKMLVYAQNDPLWANMRYENRTSNTRRMFGSGGCGPTSVAMAVVNLVPRDRLADIFGYAKSPVGFVFSENSVNQYSENKLQYQVQSPDEYLRYFPLVMANFATGNNLWGEVSRGTTAGTSLKFVKRVAFLYKLSLTTTGIESEALDAVRRGALAVASLGSFNPFTGGGHYIVLASVDDQFAYFLDPYRQTNYDRFDKKHILSSIAPGVVRVKLEDVKQLHIGTSYLLTPTDKTASNDLPSVSR
ncbi:MAG TPA: class B sortase [Candidatus Limiplasma sp.]|nr:class B sortase [Candidatus Limiplasma sp.]